MPSTLDAFIDQVVRTLDRYQHDSENWKLRTSAYLEGMITTMRAETVLEVKQLVMDELNEMLPPTIRQMLFEALENNGYLPPPRNAGQVEIAEIELENRQVSQSVSQSVSQFQFVSEFRPAGKPTDGRLASGEYDEYIRQCRKAKLPVQEIADELGVSKSGVERRITKLKERGRL